VGLLEDAGAVAVGAREGATDEPEQLGLDERGGDRAAVEDDERPVTTRARVVNGAREQLLARARLPDEQHRFLCGRRDLEAREEGAHDERPPHRLAETRGARQRQLARCPGHPQAELPLPHARSDARTEHHLADLKVPDEGAVLAVEIAQDDAVVAEREHAVSARDVGIVDDHGALGAGAHHEGGHLQRRDDLDRGGRDQNDLERWNRDGGVTQTRQRARRIVGSLRHRASS